MFFFFSSRRRHTRYIGDWSSDVCSSDLERILRVHVPRAVNPEALAGHELDDLQPPWRRQSASLDPTRSVAQGQIGRASCRERVEVTVAAVPVLKMRGGQVVHHLLMNQQG